MSVVTQVQTVTQRLAPSSDETLGKTPLITWPFLPRVQENSVTQQEAAVMPTEATSKSIEAAAHGAARPKPINRRENLLRSSSFVKIRQFCNQSCDALMFLRDSRTTLQVIVNRALVQAKACALVLAVYLAVAILTLQLATCMYMLTGKPAPAGLVFMVASLFAIVAMFSKIIVNFTKRTSRKVKRSVNLSKKIK